MAITRRAPLRSSARVSPPGPGPTSITVASLSSPAARAILAVRLRSSRKFWPSAFFACRPCRSITSRRGGNPSMVTRPPLNRASCSRGVAAAVGKPAREPQRSDQAVRARNALAGYVEGRAVVRGGADEGQAERDVDGLVEGQHLGRDQRLVVIH